MIDNLTNAKVIKGYTDYVLKSHSLYVGVYGGDAQDLAQAIFKKKNQGCDLNGKTSYHVYDTENYCQPPYPEYTVRWQTVSTPRISFIIELEKSDYLPANIIELVRDSVISAFNGEDGGTRARIGASMSAGRYYAGIYNIDPVNISILSLNLSRDGTNYLPQVEFGINEIPTLDRNNIKVELA